jgi:hypothetical protein
MRVASIVCVVVAGCGTPSAQSFLLETTDCAVVNNFKVDGAATPWTDCRVYWSGSSTSMLTVELTTPGTTGSFVAPAAGWARANLHVPAGGVDGDHAIKPLAASTLPTSRAANEIGLDIPLTGCGNVGAVAGMVDVMADVGDGSVSFSMSVALACGTAQLTGGFIVTASGSMTTGDPATVVTTPQ